MANSNGAYAGAQGAAMYNNGVNGGGMPIAGHYSDMQALMHSMDTLASLLQQNRQDFLGVQEGLERVERTHGRAVNGVSSDASSPINATTSDNNNSANNLEADSTSTTALRRELDAARAHIAMLEQRSKDHMNIQTQYEEVLGEAMDRTRNYVFQQTEYINALHQHYAKVIDNAREETVTAQLIHQGWQTSLARLNEQLKLAMQSRAKEKDPYRRRLAMLQEENRVMREKLGWEKIEWDSDEEEEEMDNGEVAHPGQHQFRGRPSRLGGMPVRERGTESVGAI